MAPNEAARSRQSNQAMIGNWPAEQVEKIARAYYEHDKTQAEIAGKENISRQLVNKILRVARQEGLVEIYIRSSLVKPEYLSILEKKLIAKYPRLKRVSVVAAFTQIKDNNLQLSADTVFPVTKAAASLIQQHFGTKHRPLTVVVSPGQILSHIVSSLEFQELFPQVRVLPALGFFNIQSVPHEANIIALEFARACGAQHFFLPTEAYHRPQDALTSHNLPAATKRVLGWIEEPDLFITGISKPPYKQIEGLVRKAQDMNLPEENLNQLRELIKSDHFKQRVVAAIAGQYFDSDGLRATEIDQIFGDVIGLQLATLAKRVRQGKTSSIAAVGGDLERVPGILGAIKGSYINALVTDHLTAQALLNGD